ncbi:MAG: hypothetical protein AAGF82_11945, partial [Pseudomonadota bacterium]
MDNQTQSFLELCAMNDLVQLAADKRAAWLWSSDGARVLWSNAAGAAFFSAQSVADVYALTALERSPARPHIARIATSGLTDRFSIDRLRFYRGLRVMLLTCQCKRVDLGNGETAALIVCSDKGLALTKEPIPAFAHLLRSSGATVFLVSEGAAEETHGDLEGTPEYMSLPEGQKVLIGQLELNGRVHEGGLLQIPAGPRIYVLNDDPLEEPVEAETDTPAQDGSTPGDATVLAPALAAATTGDASTAGRDEPEAVEETDLEQPADIGSAEADDTASAAEREASPPDEEMPDLADAELTADTPDAPSDTDADDDAPAADAPLDESETGIAAEDAEDAVTAAEEREHEAEPPETADGTETEAAAEADAQTTVASDQDQPETDGDDALADPSAEDQSPAATELPEEGTGGAFVFQPRRRPVRFAWKMDVEQRFTFLSDEFAEVLGPDATDIVGCTWEEVSDEFGLDPRDIIARALDRRDTWSGKTVAWPVTGAALRVPVDLAALPAFDRNRKFEGYRGFGVCRTADAVQDPSGFIPSPLQAPDTGATEDDAALPEDADRDEPALAETAEDTADVPQEAEGNAPMPETEDGNIAGEDDADIPNEALEPEAGSPDADSAGHADRADADASLEAAQTPDTSPDPELESADRPEVDHDVAASSPDAEIEDTGADEDTGAADGVDPGLEEDARGSEDSSDAAGPSGAEEGSDSEEAGGPAEDNTTEIAASSQDSPVSSAAPAPEQPSEDAAPATEEVEQNAEDLTPAKPDSLAGKTFLGASAAALVGSLARFKGKKTPTPAAASNDQDDVPVGEPEPEVSLSEDLKNAAAALDAGLEGDALSAEDGEPSQSEPADTPNESADSNQVADETVGHSPEANSDPATAAEARDHQSDETEPEPSEAVLPEARFEQENGHTHPEDAGFDESEDRPDEGAADTGAEEAQIEEPVGIAGSAPLKPAEIESAVKTLAKSYKAPERRAPDLFEDTNEAEASAGLEAVATPDAAE